MTNETIKIDLEHILSMLIDSIAGAQEADLLLALSPSYETIETKRRRINIYNELILYFAEIYFINKKARKHLLDKSREDDSLHLTLEHNHQLYLKKISAHIYFYNQCLKRTNENNRLNENYFTLFHK